VLCAICESVNLDPDAILRRADAAEIKDRLRMNTEELIARGGFGSPTMFVNRDDMYFGNDRLPLVEAALMR
jgi:2-hydroxychromene-2-carboxylate isomerase